MEEKELTPSQYFEKIKNAKNTATLESIKNSYGVMALLAEKYNTTGQTRSLRKLNFLADVLKKEEKLIELGIDTFVYRDMIEDYIDHVSKDAVKVIELSRYTREIPDEIVEVIKRTKGIFDELYVVFTDYTGKEERKIAQERRDKDPILFGCFKNDRMISDRFYVLGDWVDEYCDLTFDKFVEGYKSKHEETPERKITVPQTAEELKQLLSMYKVPDEDGDDRPRLFAVSAAKPSILARVRSWIKL